MAKSVHSVNVLRLHRSGLDPSFCASIAAWLGADMAVFPEHFRHDSQAGISKKLQFQVFRQLQEEPSIAEKYGPTAGFLKRTLAERDARKHKINQLKSETLKQLQ